jgi:hypothetical protein
MTLNSAITSFSFVQKHIHHYRKQMHRHILTRKSHVFLFVNRQLHTQDLTQYQLGLEKGAKRDQKSVQDFDYAFGAKAGDSFQKKLSAFGQCYVQYPRPTHMLYPDLLHRLPPLSVFNLRPS